MLYFNKCYFHRLTRILYFVFLHVCSDVWSLSDYWLQYQRNSIQQSIIWVGRHYWPPHMSIYLFIYIPTVFSSAQFCIRIFKVIIFLKMLDFSRNVQLTTNTDQWVWSTQRSRRLHLLVSFFKINKNLNLAPNVLFLLELINEFKTRMISLGVRLMMSTFVINQQ